MRVKGWSSLAVLLFALGAGPAAAWEHVYGPPGSRDQAARRVLSVNDCPPHGAGYLAVGTLDQTGADPDVYLVFTNAAGVAYWELGYDVQSLGLADEGVAAAQVPTASGGGFVLLSNSLDGVWRPALTRIGCDGTVAWSQIYPDALAGLDLRGRDLIRTANGDLAVAGYGWNGANDDAFLMRTTAAGAILWSSTYQTGASEAFHALAEAAAKSGQPTGDLMAVGRYTQSNGNLQGLAARVAGNNGAIGAAPQCIAHHGSTTSNEVYNSVIRLANTSYADQFAMTGTTSATSWLDDIWLTRGNPCALAAQTRIGSVSGTGAPAAEAGFDLKEILLPPPPPTGRMTVVGSQAAGIAAPRDAALVQVTTSTLLPVAASGRLFGDHGPFDEVFHSVSENPFPFGLPVGSILAGFTEGAWETPQDPRDLYLVYYNSTSTAPACHLAWAPAGVTLNWPRTVLTAQRRSPPAAIPVQTSSASLATGILICN